jgi:bacterioferritin-associated ferredoxin
VITAGAVLGAWMATMWDLETHYVRGALIQPETVLCRCETVTARQVAVAVDDGALTPGDVKRMTRAGMGECQGTHCRALIARGVSLLTGRAAEAEPPMSFRPPVTPVALAGCERPGRLTGLPRDGLPVAGGQHVVHEPGT